MKTNTKTPKTAASNEKFLINSLHRRQFVLKLIMFLVVILSGVALKAQDTVWTWQHFPIPEDVKFMPDGKSMLCATQKGVFHLNLNKNVLDTFNINAILLDISPDGTKFVSFIDSTIVFFDLLKKEIIQSSKRNNYVSFVSFTKDGKFIISISRIELESYYIEIWDAKDLQLLKTINVTENNWQFAGCVFDKKNEYFLLLELKGFDPYSLKISKWKIGTWEKVSDLIVFPQNVPVNEMAISPDCKYLACAMQKDSTVNIYDYETGKLIKRYLHTKGEYFVRSVTFSNDSKYLISGIWANNYNNLNTKIWNTETNEIIKSYPFALAFIELSVDSKYICSIGGTNKWNGLILLNSPSEFTSVQEDDIIVTPETVSPNPTTNQAEIKLSLSKSQNLTVDVTNDTGGKLFNVFNGIMSAGFNNLTIDLTTYPSGIYLCRIQSEIGTKTIKIVKQY